MLNGKMVGELGLLDNGANQWSTLELIQTASRGHQIECMKVMDFVGTSDWLKNQQTPTHACLVQKKKHQQKNVSDIWRKKKHVDLGIICSFALIFCFILKV